MKICFLYIYRDEGTIFTQRGLDHRLDDMKSEILHIFKIIYPINRAPLAPWIPRPCLYTQYVTTANHFYRFQEIRRSGKMHIYFLHIFSVVPCFHRKIVKVKKSNLGVIHFLRRRMGGGVGFEEMST